MHQEDATKDNVDTIKVSVLTPRELEEFHENGDIIDDNFETTHEVDDDKSVDAVDDSDDNNDVISINSNSQQSNVSSNSDVYDEDDTTIRSSHTNNDNNNDINPTIISSTENGTIVDDETTTINNNNLLPMDYTSSDVDVDISPDQHPALRRSQRQKLHDWKTKDFKGFMSVIRSYNQTFKHKTLNLNIKKMLNDYGEKGKASVFTELENILVNKKALIPIKNIPKDACDVIPAHLFGKEKIDPDGNFDKLKSRLAAGGDKTNDSMYGPEDKSSPTVTPEAVNIMLAISANTRCRKSTTDVTAAYLNAYTKKKHVVVLNKEVTNIIIEKLPMYKEYVQSNGSMYTIADKAIYGLPESGLLWYLDLKSTILNLGYIINEADPCCFHKYEGTNFSHIAVYVDDILNVTNNQNMESNLINGLKAKYKEITSNFGNDLKYLGMKISTNPNGDVELSMPNYINDILKQNNITFTSKTPGNKNLFNDQDDINKETVNKTKYLSVLMSTFYLAKKIKPELLTSLSYLSTRSKNPNSSDMLKLIKTLEYLNGNKNDKLVFKHNNGKPLTLTGYFDASYAPHSDKKSHSGEVIVFEDCGLLYCSSSKQKMTVDSACGAELISLHKGVKTLMWIKRLLKGFRIKTHKTKVYQDNQSTIMISESPFSSNRKTRHLDIRYNYIKDLIDDESIVLEYLPTSKMIADILTKPLSGKLFETFKKKLFVM
jgi:hypothetical protein